MDGSRIRSPDACSLESERSDHPDHPGYHCLTRAEKVDIVFALAAAGCGECCAEIILMLERDGADQDPMLERPKF